MLMAGTRGLQISKCDIDKLLKDDEQTVDETSGLKLLFFVRIGRRARTKTHVQHLDASVRVWTLIVTSLKRLFLPSIFDVGQLRSLEPQHRGICHPQRSNGLRERRRFVDPPQIPQHHQSLKLLGTDTLD